MGTVVITGASLTRNGPVLVGFEARNRAGKPDRSNRDASSQCPGDLHMSAKLTLAALAAILTVVSLQGPASARGVSPTANDLRSDPAFSHLQGSRALGSINVGATLGRASNNVMFGGRSVGRDPDANVRFQLMRDQARDRL
jgi:hypothetical protein